MHGQGEAAYFPEECKDVAVYGDPGVSPIAIGPLREEEMPWTDFMVNGEAN